MLGLLADPHLNIVKFILMLLLEFRMFFVIKGARGLNGIKIVRFIIKYLFYRAILNILLWLE